MIYYSAVINNTHVRTMWHIYEDIKIYMHVWGTLIVPVGWSVHVTVIKVSKSSTENNDLQLTIKLINMLIEMQRCQALVVRDSDLPHALHYNYIHNSTAPIIPIVILGRLMYAVIKQTHIFTMGCTHTWFWNVQLCNNALFYLNTLNYKISAKTSNNVPSLNTWVPNIERLSFK